MALDAQSEMVLGVLEQLDFDGLMQQEPAAVRQRMVEARGLPPGPDAQVAELRVAGGDGEIGARIYRPRGVEGPLGTLVFAHGGGFVLGDLDGHDAVCRQLAVDAGCCVISLDYGLAPEAKFPAAPEDCYAALCFVHDNAAALGVDPARLAIGGDSAGGTLAAVTAQLTRDRGGPPLALQLLMYPCTDLRAFDTASHVEHARGYFLTRDAMEWFRGHYLRDEADRRDPRASPLLARDLAGLAPALVITAEHDPLRDEGEAYARALEEAGVAVTATRYDGTIHGFVAFYAFIDSGKRALAECAAVLREALG